MAAYFFPQKYLSVESSLKRSAAEFFHITSLYYHTRVLASEVTIKKSISWSQVVRLTSPHRIPIPLRI